MPRTPALPKRALPPRHEYAWPTRADRKPGEDTVGWPGLRAAGGLVAGETGWSRGDTAKAGRASGAAAFISGAISLATTQEDRLADGNINPSPSCLTSVP